MGEGRKPCTSVYTCDLDVGGVLHLAELVLGDHLVDAGRRLGRARDGQRVCVLLRDDLDLDGRDEFLAVSEPLHFRQWRPFHLDLELQAVLLLYNLHG